MKISEKEYSRLVQRPQGKNRLIVFDEKIVSLEKIA